MFAGVAATQDAFGRNSDFHQAIVGESVDRERLLVDQPIPRAEHLELLQANIRPHADYEWIRRDVYD
jgi:hypothetical protein